MHAIPTLDFSPFRTGDAAARRAIAGEIGDAFERYGFLQLIGHGVPMATVDGAFAAAAAFFDKPEGFKRSVQDRRNNRGYVPLFASATPGTRPGGHEAFSVGHFARPSDPALLELPFHAATPWPDMAGFQDRLEACYRAMYAVAQEILRAAAMHLGAPEDFFAEAARETYSNMRVIHYPPAEAVAETTDVGVRAHEDEGLITLLIQDMNGGLSVLGPAGDWLPVVPNRAAMVINVGKLLRRWTNGRYRAALHMVVNRSGRDRYAIPLFVHPSYHTRVDPMSLVGQAAAGPEFAPIVAGEEVYANFKARSLAWKELPA